MVWHGSRKLSQYRDPHSKVGGARESELTNLLVCDNTKISDQSVQCYYGDAA